MVTCLFLSLFTALERQSSGAYCLIKHLPLSKSRDIQSKFGDGANLIMVWVVNGTGSTYGAGFIFKARADVGQCAKTSWREPACSSRSSYTTYLLESEVVYLILVKHRIDLPSKSQSWNPEAGAVRTFSRCMWKRDSSMKAICVAKHVVRELSYIVELPSTVLAVPYPVRYFLPCPGYILVSCIHHKRPCLASKMETLSS